MIRGGVIDRGERKKKKAGEGRSGKEREKEDGMTMLRLTASGTTLRGTVETDPFFTLTNRREMGLLSHLRVLRLLLISLGRSASVFCHEKSPSFYRALP